MMVHADAPELVLCVADLARATVTVRVTAGALHRAGLAGASAAAATVTDRMIRVAARALALVRRGVAGRADGTVACPAAERTC
jgi:hypothetical protein